MPPILDLFSKRQKLTHCESPDVYQYTKFEKTLRVQIIHIIRDAFGEGRYAKQAYEIVIELLSREYGVFELLPDYINQDSEEHLLSYFLQEQNVDKALDVVELCFTIISTQSRSNEYNIRKLDPDEAIAELNARFKENGFGFQFEVGKIIKINSEYMYNEVIKQALSLLSRKEFEGANQEFLLAHEHYRAGQNKACLNECLNSFESIMKSICSLNKITVDSRATAKTLIAVLFENEIIPAFLKSEYSSFQAVLESGVPTIRNKLSGHGQGETIRKVEDCFAEYMLNLTASNIIFLAKCI